MSHLHEKRLTLLKKTVLTLLATSGFLVPTPVRAAVVDPANLELIDSSNFDFAHNGGYTNRRTGEITDRYILTHVGSQTLEGPFILEVVITPSDVTSVLNTNDETTTGNALINFTQNTFSPGDSINYELKFANPGRTRFTYVQNIYRPASTGPTNTAPVADAINVTGTEDQPLPIQLLGTDDDSDPLSYSLLSQPLSGTLTGTVPDLIYTPDLNFNGPDQFSYLVNDGTEDSNSAIVSITITPVNDAPTVEIDSPADSSSFQPGTTIPILSTASDSDGEVIQVDYTISRNGVSEILTASGSNPYTYDWIPAAPGAYTIQATATDNEGATGVSSIIAVVVENNPPQFTTAPVTSANVERPYTYNSEAVDPDGDIVTYQLLASPTAMSLDSNTGLVEWLPGSTDIGNFSVTIRATDVWGATDIQTFVIGIGDPSLNRPPVITSNPVVSVPANDFYSYDVEATDPDQDDLTFSLLTNPGGMIIDATSGLIEWQPDIDDLGDHPVSVQVDDGRGGIAQQDFTVTVLPLSGNRPPVFISEPITSIVVHQGFPEDYVYDSEALDGDNDVLEYSLVSGPDGISVDVATGEVLWMVSADNPGTEVYPVELLVADGNGGFDRQSYSIEVTVIPNLPPEIISTPAVRTLVNQTYRYAVSATDPERDTLTYELTNAPAEMSIDPVSGLIEWNPDTTGTVSISIKVTDPLGGSDTQDYELEVTDSADGRITGYKWNDLNADGVWDEDEPGVPGVTIYLDYNGNGLRDPDEPFTITQSDDPSTIDIDEAGFYVFETVFSGTYLVREELPAGSTQSFPGTNGHSITVEDFIAYSYTDAADWALGEFTNTNNDSPNENRVVLNEAQNITTPFESIWIALSGRGTIVRINTETGEILGEYWTSPSGLGKNPSRTTVDQQGNVWVGNRDEQGWLNGRQMGSVTRVGFCVGGTRGDKNPDGSFTPNPNGEYLQGPFEYNTCIDRDGDGLIRTSRGIGHRLDWTNAGGVDTDGGVDTAQDEAIINFTRTRARTVRAVAVDANNDVWVGGNSGFGTPRDHEKIDGITGQVIPGTWFDVRAGGYGALVDPNGIVWSASLNPQQLLRYNPVDGTSQKINLGRQSYGLGIDLNGNIWNSNWTNNTIQKISPDGTILGTFSGGNGNRGVVITPVDNHVWIANSNGSSVTRLDNDGNFIARIGVGATPTGVAVDSLGKVWVTNFGSNNAMRIDPATNTVDLTVTFPSGSTPYNYSDMTGTGLLTSFPEGSWTVVQDGGIAGREWRKIIWNTEPFGFEPESTAIIVEARVAEAAENLGEATYVEVTNDTDINLLGRYIQVRVRLQSEDVNLRPALSDLTIIAEDIAVADFGNVSTVDNETDLVITDIDVSGLLYDGQNLTVSGNIQATIKNQGFGTVQSDFTILFFEDRDGNGAFDSGVDAALGETVVSGVLPTNQSIQVEALLSGEVLFGSAPVLGFVDSNDQILEIDELNNFRRGNRGCTLEPIVGQFNPVIEWNKLSFSVASASDQVVMTPAVADLNQDGIPDIVFSTYNSSDLLSNGVLRAISGDNGEEIWSIIDTSFQVRGLSSIAIGDIDLDGLPEIIAVHESDAPMLVEHDGNVTKIGANPGFQIRAGGAAIADLDQDGVPEIVIGDAVFNNDLTLRWQGNGSKLSDNYQGPLSLVADLNLDGLPEILVGSKAYHHDGTLFWDNANIADGFPALGNFDDDPFPEIALVSKGSVYLLEHTGAVVWGPVSIPGSGAIVFVGSGLPVPPPNGMGGAPTVADFDADGEVEIAVAGASRYCVYETDGSLKWSSVINDTSSNCTGSSVFDFEGDGAAEIIYGDEKFLRIYRGSDGAVLYQLEKSSRTSYEMPIVVDVDADGAAEIVAIANNWNLLGNEKGIFVIGDANGTWVPTRQIWNQHTYHINNINDDATIPQFEQNSWLDHNSYRLNAFPQGQGALDAPDLVPSYLRAEETLSQVTYTIRIGNTGSATAQAPFSVAFYDGNPLGDGNLLESVEVTQDIPAGAYRDVSFSIAPSVAYTLDLVVAADDDGLLIGQLDGVVEECDETNNIYQLGGGLVQPNSAPEITSSPVLGADAEGLYRYDVGAVDPDGDDLIFDLTLAPEGMSISENTGVIVWQPDVFDIGFNNVTVRVRDGRFGQDTQTFTIRVRSANVAPVITSEPKTSAAVGELYSYQVTAQDGNFDPLVFNLDTPPGGDLSQFNLDSDSGFFEFVPTSAELGDHEIVLSVNDGRGGFTTQTYTLTVVESLPNTAPVITSQPSGLVAFGATYFYQIEAEDNEGDTLAYELLNGPEGMEIDPFFGLILWQPTEGQFSTYPVSVRVSDGRGGETTQDFSIEVVSYVPNQAPFITSTPIANVTLGTTYRYDVDATDPNRDLITYSLREGPDGMSIDFFTGQVIWTPASGQLGQQQITVTAFDSRGAFQDQSFVLTVSVNSLPPSIISQPELQQQAVVGEPYQYQIIAEDPENGTLTFILSEGPAGMVIDTDTGLVSWTPVASDVGLNTIKVGVADSFGNTVYQAFQLDVLPEGQRLNGAPVITSTPLFNVRGSALYETDVDATDPDADVITYELLKSPAGMTIDPITGLIQWQTTADQNGLFNVEVSAVDPFGAASIQSFSISVRPNNPPQILSSPVVSVNAGGDYNYTVIATDIDGDPISFSLVGGPTGMVIDATGRITWPTVIGDQGTFPVVLEVTDNFGESDSQSFTLEVVPDENPPFINLVATSTVAELDETIGITVEAQDESELVSLTLSIDGSVIVPDSLIQENARTLRLNKLQSFSGVGTKTLLATATDGSGNINTFTTTIQVVDPNDVAAPVVEIASPTDDAIITAPTDVIGTVQDDSLLFYTLAVAPVAGGEFREIFRGEETVTDGVLGQFDPSLLLNDSYILRLRAVDAGGKTSTIDRIINVAGELKLGNFTLSFTDLTVPVSGIPIVVTRTYDTLNANTENDLGFGWRLDIRDTDLRTSVPRNDLEGVGIFNAFSFNTRVYVTLPGGEREGFTFKPKLAPGLKGGFLGIYEPYFEPDPDVTSELTVSNFDLRIMDDGTVRPWIGGSLPYNPANSAFGTGNYTLTTKEGITYTIDGTTGSLDTVTDLNGNALNFTDEGIFSSSGQRITFERDSQGRISAVVDPMDNKIFYEYDSKGDLISVTDREGNETQFIYRADRDHYLEEVIDPFGRTGVRSVYDDAGRLIRMIDADDQEIQLVYDPDNFVYTVVDRLGNPTVYEYDDRGNVLTEIDPLGNVTRRTYDDPNNPISETSMTDPLGNTTSFTYDSRANVLTETDPLGNVTTFTYNAFSDPTSITDNRGNTTLFAYDSGNGNPLSHTDAEGNVTTFAYDSSGNLTTMTDAEGNVTTNTYDSFGNTTKTEVRDIDGTLLSSSSYTYDGNGNQLTQTILRTLYDEAGNATGTENMLTQFEYDSENRVIRTTFPDNTFTTASYNELGKQTTSTDQLGRTTAMFYDDRDNLVRTVYPDATEESMTYDLENHRLSSTDRLGRTTYFVYDELGRMTDTIHPDDTMPADPTAFTTSAQILADTDLADNPTTSTLYDEIGRVATSFDERGNPTLFTYDPECGCSSRRTAVTNALDQLTNFAYDENGNQLSMTDANGHITSFVYNKNNFPTRTIFHDGTYTETVYDGLNRRIAEIDQEGKVKEFSYDGLGRLVQVTEFLAYNAPGDPERSDPANVLETRYTYDEVGNLIAQTNAEGRTTRYQYDSLGRRIKRFLPDGEVESMTYYDNGNLEAKTDFNGYTTTYLYDSLDRLIEKQADPTHPSVVNNTGPAFIVYTYDDAGQRISAATLDSTRTVLNQNIWTYDERGRVLSKDGDQGVLSYTYDVANNLTGMQSDNTNGVDLTYTYDALNRLSTVSDSGASVPPAEHTYSYDEVGNLKTLTYQNGVTHTWTYNSLNRLTNVTISNQASQILNAFSYTLNASGHRAQMVEQNGRTVDYTYDDLYRLTDESISSDPVGLNGDVMFSYDKVGNRLTRISTVTNIDTQNFTYDANDRLDSDTYDANGNTIQSQISNLESEIVGVGYTDEYDFENRLVKRTYLTGKTITISYDADGNRIQKTLQTSPLALPTFYFYLVDRNNLTGYAQVFEELRDDGTGGLEVFRTYTCGLDLVAQHQLHPPEAPTEWKTSYYLYDGLGTVRALADENGTITDTYTYSAFGEMLNSTSNFTPPIANLYLFTGEQYDRDLEMYFLRARYMNPSKGRFHNMDIFEGRSQYPITLHKYLYANAIPTMLVDPSGLVSIVQMILTLDVQSALRTGQVQTSRVLVKRGGCFAMELATEAILDKAIFEGLYLFIDATRNDAPYGGRSNDVNRRQEEHKKHRTKKGIQNRVKQLLMTIPVIGASKAEMRGLEEWLIQTIMSELGINPDGSLRKNARIANNRHELNKKERVNLSKFFKFCK